MRGNKLLGLSCLTLLGLAIWLAPDAWAQTATSGVDQVRHFIESLMRIVISLAGLIATGFFIVGGLSYITSAGNPVALQRAKRTIFFAGLGLVITIAAFALTGIIGDAATQSFS